MWAEKKVKELLDKKEEGNVLATGITPSGPIHVGSLREVLTAEGVYKMLKEEDEKAELIYIADDFDRLRKVYPFLPEDFKEHVGRPLTNVPDPKGCHENYAQHFLAPFFESLKKLGVEVKKLSAYNMYKKGRYTEEITKALKNKEKIKELLEEISNRDLPKTWQPFDPLCSECKRIDKGKVLEVNYDNTSVKYVCEECGHKGWADYSQGEGKLAWRVDWPARWKMLNVTFEPFGKEHGASGGSWDTSKAICKEVFNYDPPLHVQYEFVYLKGEKGKMSSSLGNVVSAEDILKVAPPEIVRYFFFKRRPNKHIKFDPGEGLMRLISQYSQMEKKAKKGELGNDKKMIYELCQIGEGSLPAVSFRHLVEVYQAAQGDLEEIERILERTGHKKDLKDKEKLKEQIERVKFWLDNFAPEKYKFEIKEDVPETKLSNKQRKLLGKLSEKLKKKELTGEEIHNSIYNIGKELGLSAKKRFEPIYLSLLGQTFGPKAGWFIDALDKDFVVKRFKKMSKGE